MLMPSIRKVETTNMVLTASILGIRDCLQRGKGNMNDCSVQSVIGGVLLIYSAATLQRLLLERLLLEVKDR